jgi:hypothetical protein
MSRHKQATIISLTRFTVSAKDFYNPDKLSKTAPRWLAEVRCDDAKTSISVIVTPTIMDLGITIGSRGVVDTASLKGAVIIGLLEGA